MWNERYSTKEYVYGTQPNRWLEERAGSILEGGRVLCLADGEGRNGVWLAEQGFEVTSVDLSEVGLEKARELAGERGVEIETVCADLAEWDLGGPWDAIVSVWAHMPSADREKLHRRVVNALASGGVLILEAYRPDQLNAPGRGGPPDADKMMTVEALAAELKGLEFRALENATYEVDEGQHHQGESHVVRAEAIKR